MRRLERNFSRRDPYEAAVEIREKFTDAPATKEEEVPWKWPRRMQEVGQWESGEGAICYSSNKWQRNPKQMIDYKHVAEGPQRLLVLPGFLRDYHRPGKKLPVGGPMVDVNGPMPKAFAVLAPILGIQARLYEGSSRDYTLPDDSFYQIDIANATLCAAKHPKTGKTFLFICTKNDGPVCIITGDILDVEKDGVVG